MSAFDFANLLFSGPCSARCPFCIGRQIDSSRTPPNLGQYPPRGLDRFIELIHHYAIPQVVLTGANTDPQLYRHEARLLERLRRRLPTGTQISLHTNGRQMLQKMELANGYDRVCLSFPSFEPETYRRVMGVPNPPDLTAILRRARIPVKISCVLTGHNLPEIGDFLRRCRELGVRRVVLRKLYGDPRSWAALLPAVPLQAAGEYRGNPVFDYVGMQVTLWDFARAESRSINLFSSGDVTEEYLLTRVRAAEPDAAADLLRGQPVAVRHA